MFRALKEIDRESMLSRLRRADGTPRRLDVEGLVADGFIAKEDSAVMTYTPGYCDFDVSRGATKG